jgi:hypothetical protein
VLNGTAGGEALVLFAGGRTDTGTSNAVDIYNVCVMRKLARRD